MIGPTLLKTVTQCRDYLKRINRSRWIIAGAGMMLVLFILIGEASSQPIAVTIGELVTAPDRYSGKEVTFDGILVRRTDLYTVETSTPHPRGGRRVQLALADISGAQVLVIAYVPSYDLPTVTMLGSSGTAYSVRGIFYHIPVEPGPPLHLVVLPGKNGLRKK